MQTIKHGQECPKPTEFRQMISELNIGQTVRYYSDTGWHTGVLAGVQKKRSGAIALIQTPIAGQRKKRVPVNDVEIYTENVLKGNKK